MIINIAKDFSKYPGGRYLTDGKQSAQRFRDDFLVPTLKECPDITVEMDGTLGYPSSWLEEAFGGLVRVYGFTPLFLQKTLTFTGYCEGDVAEIWQFIKEAGEKN